jgi:uncharacterized protein YlxP (DUF503 family)
VTIGIFTLELHLPTARSLKDKRQVLRRLKDRLRSRFNVAVAEIDEHLDLWQRGGLMIVSVASTRDALSRLFESIQRDSAALVPGELIPGNPEFIESADGGSAGWSEEWE